MRRFLGNLNRTHSAPVRRAAELLRWADSGDYERIVLGEYVVRGQEPPGREAAGDAVGHYSDRFRQLFEEAGSGVGSLGRKVAGWVRGS